MEVTFEVHKDLILTTWMWSVLTKFFDPQRKKKMYVTFVRHKIAFDKYIIFTLIRMQNYHWPFMEKCHWTLMYTKYSLSSTTDCLLEVFGRLTYWCLQKGVHQVRWTSSLTFTTNLWCSIEHTKWSLIATKNVIASLVSCWQTYILEAKVVACPANLHVSLRWKPARRTHRHDLWVLPRRRDDIGGVVVDDCDCRCTNRFADEQCHRGDLAPSFSLARLHRRVRFRATAPPLPERAAGCCVIQS